MSTKFVSIQPGEECLRTSTFFVRIKSRDELINIELYILSNWAVSILSDLSNNFTYLESHDTKGVHKNVFSTV